MTKLSLEAFERWSLGNQDPTALDAWEAGAEWAAPTLTKLSLAKIIDFMEKRCTGVDQSADALRWKLIADFRAEKPDEPGQSILSWLKANVRQGRSTVVVNVAPNGDITLDNLVLQDEPACPCGTAYLRVECGGYVPVCDCAVKNAVSVELEKQP